MSIMDYPDVSPKSAPVLPRQTYRRHEPHRHPSKFDLTPFKANPVLYQKALDEAIRQENLEAIRSASSFQVQFRYVCATAFGQTVKVVGNHDTIGSWNPDHALQLQWSTGDVWTGQVIVANVPGKCLEFKYILVTGDKLKWESGENRKLQLGDGGELRGGRVSHIVTHQWRS